MTYKRQFGRGLLSTLEVLTANDADLGGALTRVFGTAVSLAFVCFCQPVAVFQAGIAAMFGRASAEGARRLDCSGFNHARAPGPRLVCFLLGLHD